MMPTGEITFNPKAKTGFQAKFSDQLYQSLFIDRQEQSFPDNINHEERGPPPKSGIQPQEDEENSKKLEELVEAAQIPLLKMKTAIPFNPFPDEVIIDVNKVSIIYRTFFFSKHVHSILIKDISDIVIETSPFFATLKIVDIGYTDNSIDVKYLKTGDAHRARRIIQGLVVAHKYGVNLSKINSNGICKKIEDLGTVEQRI